MNLPLTRPADTLSPAAEERDGVRGSMREVLTRGILSSIRNGGVGRGENAPHRVSRLGTRNQSGVRGMRVKGMSSIPLTIIPLTLRLMESSLFLSDLLTAHEPPSEVLLVFNELRRRFMGRTRQIQIRALSP